MVSKHCRKKSYQFNRNLIKPIHQLMLLVFHHYLLIICIFILKTLMQRQKEAAMFEEWEKQEDEASFYHSTGKAFSFGTIIPKSISNQIEHLSLK